MPRKLKPETQETQSRRFKRDAQKLIAAGDLNPTDAERLLGALIEKQAPPKKLA